VQFRCQLVEEKLIKQEVVFIDGTKIEANVNKFTFVWKKAVEKHHARLIEQSNQLYTELFEAHILPEIERERDDELSVKELGQVVEQLEKVVEGCTENINKSRTPVERKQHRRERKVPKEHLKKVREWLERKQNYENHRKILGPRNSYSKTDCDATLTRVKDDYMYRLSLSIRLYQSRDERQPYPQTQGNGSKSKTICKDVVDFHSHWYPKKQ